MTSSANAAVPERLGKYEIVKHIATGGMAELFLARSHGLEGFEKIVVVKRILPSLATDADFVKMFLDEARIAASLNHPNIVQVYDVGAVDNAYFIAMEYLHGKDVRQVMKRIRGAPMPMATAVGIILNACAGLHYTHELRGPDGRSLNIVHRDVSPQNLFLTYEGGVKLVDFGISKANSRMTETRTGTLKGKLRYMSPEQARMEVCDRRSDIFSLAIFLWELTTGRKLFHGKNDYEILKGIIEEPITRPSAVIPEYPVELERIVMHGLERDKNERYQTVHEMQLELESFARTSDLVVTPFELARFMKEIEGGEVPRIPIPLADEESAPSKRSFSGTPLLNVEAIPEEKPEPVAELPQFSARALPLRPPSIGPTPVPSLRAPVEDRPTIDLGAQAADALALESSVSASHAVPSKVEPSFVTSQGGSRTVPKWKVSTTSVTVSRVKPRRRGLLWAPILVAAGVAGWWALNQGLVGSPAGGLAGKAKNAASGTSAEPKAGPARPIRPTPRDRSVGKEGSPASSAATSVKAVAGSKQLPAKVEPAVPPAPPAPEIPSKLKVPEPVEAPPAKAKTPKRRTSPKRRTRRRGPTKRAQSRAEAESKASETTTSPRSTPSKERKADADLDAPLLPGFE